MKHFNQIIIPLLGFIIFGLHFSIHNLFFSLVSIIALIATVLSSVHHAEIIAQKIGEPFGGLVLALAITVIEASIIISMMLTGNSQVSVLARDTVFAAIMIIMTGITGLILFIGGIKFKEQSFATDGISAVFIVLVTISVLTLILPNFTVAEAGPYYSTMQLLFVAIITLLLYGSFLFVQNFRHKDHFIAVNEIDESVEIPSKRETFISAIFLPFNLIAVVLLAESMAPDLELFIVQLGAPVSLAGIIIASIILLPEGISAIKAVNKNQIQRSLNLSLGSALASISLTIPVVAIFSVISKIPLELGINTESVILFLLALFILILSLIKGRTTILQGIVLLLLFLVYIFLTIVP